MNTQGSVAPPPQAHARKIRAGRRGPKAGRVLGSRHIAVVLGCVALSAFSWNCSTMELWRPPMATPDHFLAVEGDGGGSPVEPVADGRCHSPLVDPSDGTRILMVRAENGYGDYVVPDGRYGVGKDDILRIQCSTGRPVGIFTRRDD
jgi:hypothetical protein